METLKHRFLGLCVPPLLLCLSDVTLTLVGQSSQYWAGDYANVNEASPTFYQLLRVHPAAFAAGELLWVIVFVGGILLLPSTFALIVSMVVTFAHAGGAATWLLYRFQYGYQACNGLFLLSAILLGIGIRWGWRALPDREYRLAGWPPLVRWGLAAMLFALAVYLYLWPRNPFDDEVSADGEGAAQVVEAVASTDRELEQLADEAVVTHLSAAGAEITSAALKHLERLTRLQGLHLRDVHVTDASLEHLGRLTELKWLYLDNVEINGAGLEHLEQLAKLDSLSLNGSQVTDTWLEHAGRLSQLQSLQIASTKITDAGLEHLKGLSQLRMLNLTGSLVSNAGLEHLEGLSQLERLYLGQTKITDAGLEHLKGLSQLQVVYLGYTNCTREGRDKLRKALPNCRIEG